jgi:hypothetical protein
VGVGVIFPALLQEEGKGCLFFGKNTLLEKGLLKQKALLLDLLSEI